MRHVMNILRIISSSESVEELNKIINSCSVGWLKANPEIVEAYINKVISLGDTK